MSNEVISLLKERRSVRSYKPEHVSRELLDQVVEAGTYSPNGRGAQCSIIVPVTNEAVQAPLRKMNAAVMNAETDTYYGAPDIIFVFAPTDHPTWVEDAASVLTYMQVAAKALGLGSCWIHRERQMFQSEEGKKIKAEWGIPEKYEGVGALSIGYADGPYPEAAPRKADYVKWID
jgi:nitroreductase